MKIEVYHTGQLVANVNVMHTNSFDDALEYAYRWTQNIDGSWSRGPQFEDGEANNDHNPAVEVIAELPVYDGKTYGLRSTMVGDILVVNGVGHKVDSFGFKEI